MTDRELLERAAKAAGLVVVGLADKFLVDPGHRAGGLVVETATGGQTAWNALTDDGDALRLACALRLDVEWRNDGRVAAYKAVHHNEEGVRVAVESSREDVPANLRRAIVCAAAAMAGEP